MLCGSGESWTVQSLSDGIKFDHGYTLASSPVKCFLEVLSELSGEDQKRFLRFVTGEQTCTTDKVHVHSTAGTPSMHMEAMPASCVAEA